MNETMTKLLPSFVDGAKEVFETMVFMPATPGEPKSKEIGLPCGEISGTIGFNGDDICGNLSLIFPMNTALAIFRNMMGMAPDSEVNAAEVNDVVGELANMVAGGAKSRLQEKDINFKIGLPSVVVGVGHSIEPPKNVQTAVVPMAVEPQGFYIELSLTS